MKLICGTYKDSANDTFVLLGGGYSFEDGDVSNSTWTRRFQTAASAGTDWPEWLDSEWTQGPDLPGPLVGAKAVPYAGGRTFLIVGSSSSDYEGGRQSPDRIYNNNCPITKAISIYQRKTPFTFKALSGNLIPREEEAGRRWNRRCLYQGRCTTRF